MKLTSILLILAMVGTGFGQDVPHVSCWIFDDAHKTGQTIVCPKHIVTIPANGSAVWWFAGTQIPSDSFAIHTGGETSEGSSGSGAVPVPFFSEQPPVDVPAIQERYKGPKNCGAKTSPGEETGWVDGMLCSQKPPLEWTCTDKENRALLTSVNGKRHSCHLIQEGK